MTDQNGIEYRECIVGNIIGNHYWGEKKEIKSGTKHFRAGTKVYCAFVYGGMGHEAIWVMGKPRKSFRMIEVVLRHEYIRNFRLQKVYAPYIIKFLDKHNQGWKVQDILSSDLLTDFNKHHREIKSG
jgi:hypothetical protein